MSYKTILVHVDQSAHAAERIRLAAAIARAENAHLIGAAMTGISRFVFDSGTINPQDTVLKHHLDFLRDYARKALQQLEQLAAEAGVTSVESRLVDDDAGGGMILQARYCDLVVLGQTNPDEAVPGLMPDFPEYVVMNCARPVLVVPFTGQFRAPCQRPLIAWDASMTATRAVTGALPLLARADQTNLVVFNADDQPDAHGEQPGADLALYLARHAVKMNVINQTIALDTGNALLSLAADLNSDMIVMGGYGHSRFREIVLGGVTRTMLTSMTVPVLMAH
jgi:nucleotide-binding universal stress UspA family protein